MLKPSDFNNPVVSSGLLAIILGLFYVLNLHNFTSDAAPSTFAWGRLLIILGLIAILGNGLHRQRYPRLYKALIYTDLAVISLMQALPVCLWLIFNGEVVGEYNSGGPVGNWIWSLPHLILAVVAGYSIYYLKYERNGLSGGTR